MTSKIKQKVAKNLFDGIHNKFYNDSYDEFMGCLKLLSIKGRILWRVYFPLKPEAHLNVDLFKSSQQELIENETITNVTFNDLYHKNVADLELNVKPFIKDVLDSDPTKLSYKSQPQKVIVEFSSPNIAKPFHAGHLRSTIIGNYIANLKKKLGKDVIKMNYLGDWGTQFGMIQIGMKLGNYSEEELQKNPIQVLFNAYVKGNREAERHQETFDEAKKIFAELEFGGEEITNIWQKYKNWTLEELNSTYSRLGISFDEYSWESDYKRKEADKILSMIEEKGMLSVDEKGRKIAALEDGQIPLLKSDDTTLYLLRDLMAVMDRKSKHDFDEMYYVVENGQNLHFTSLFALSNKLNLNQGKKLEHVKFGRIQGMSTRKGNVAFLKDILDEAKERSYENQVKSKNTKIHLHTKDTADILGVSAVVVNDLKQHRKKDYEFSWPKILQVTGDTGVQLQYCHCRLFSLEANCGAKAATDCDPEALLEPEAVNLVTEIAKFEQALWHSNWKLEPCVLVRYLFELVRATNIAFKVLKVKDSEEHVASQRLLLFNKSRQVLADGLKLLGLTVVNQM